MAHLPVLRRGQVYESLDRVELTDYRTGAPVLSVSQANAGLIRRDLAQLGSSRQALRRLTSRQFIDRFRAAGRIFREGTLPLGTDGPPQTPDNYVRMTSSTTGLPHVLCRRNMDKIYQVFTEIETILRGLTRGLDISILESGAGEQSGVPVSFYPTTHGLGVVLPSNSPGVNSLWMPAVALGIPVVLKPGRDDPWTPWRILQAFMAAGMPAEAFSFYPTDHEGSDAILRGAGRALLFGDEKTAERYRENHAVEVHGPGRSKVILGADAADDWERYLDVMVASIAENGGRSCVNASAIVVPAHADAIADALARRLSVFKPVPPESDAASLAAFRDPAVAESIDGLIEEGLKTPGAEDVTQKHRSSPRRVLAQGGTYLLPTVVRCPSLSHPLGNREFLFPFASVVELTQDKMLSEIGPSLVVTAVTSDKKFIDDLLACPFIDRLNLGPVPTSRVRWDQPHEGNLFEFLYKRRSIQYAV